MKLLFNQNISFRIVDKILDIFPDSKQVTQIGLMNRTDLEIWKYAKDNNFTIVTFDADFYDLSIIRGTPPKIIWLRMGNTKTENIIEVLHKNYELLKYFAENESYKDISCLEID